MANVEQLTKAKIPCPETGIEIKHSICDMCTPGIHCGVNAYVKDGKLIKVEGTDGFPASNGKLCTKGASMRQYVYREDRLQTPLRRVGKRGEGKFEPISWEDAYREIATRLNKIKNEDGPESVAWFTGYSKWYRAWLHRLTYSFGSQNYCTESSCCNTATGMAWKSIAGRGFKGDVEHASVLIGWGCNTLINHHVMARSHVAFKNRGGKVIIIDPRVTQTSQQIADIHLQIRPGTDGALALGMANLLIQRGWVDQPFIDRYVHGYPEYCAYVKEFTLEKAEEITGVSKELIEEAAWTISHCGPVAGYFPSATVTHHINGFNNMRAMISLQVLTGNIDRRGGDIPTYPSLVYREFAHPSREKQFINDVKPTDCKERIGAARFPVWAAMTDEGQAMDLVRQIKEGKPYPIRALCAFGMNHRMFPQPSQVLEAIDQLDFVFATELAMTEVCRHADIVLPACTSLERSELKPYGPRIMCTKPVIEPLYQSKPDTEIICDLARYLELDDELLKSGYEETMRYLIADAPTTLEELREAETPVMLKGGAVHQPGELREKGFETPTGKLELYSEKIAACTVDHPELSPLPQWRDSADSVDREQYPFTLIAGARLPNGLHTRTHTLPWTRSLRPSAAADIHPDDAAALGITEGDMMVITGQSGQVRVAAHLTAANRRGDIYLYHGYREADANELVGQTHLDPYSGFPGYRQVCCSIRKEETT